MKTMQIKGIDTYSDPLDEAITYSRFDTVAIGVKEIKARGIGVHGFSRKNKVFDPFRDPSLLLPIFLDIPCFIRILDESVYCMLEDQIICKYSDLEDSNLTPLMVIGECKLHQHPLIINVVDATPAYCWNMYKRLRRDAKKLGRKQCK